MDPTSPQSHRRLAVEANNAIWALLDLAGRTADESEDLLGRAYASAYHWRRAEGSTPANLARADYLVGRGSRSATPTSP